MRIKLGRRTATATAVAALTVGALSLATGNAFAAGPGGAEACPSGLVCLYYNSPQYGWGSWEDFSPGQSLDLSNFTFAHWGNGSGYGQVIPDHAASIVNNTSHTVIVDAYAGAGQDQIPPGYAGRLINTYNNDWWMFS